MVRRRDAGFQPGTSWTARSSTSFTNAALPRERREALLGEGVLSGLGYDLSFFLPFSYFVRFYIYFFVSTHFSTLVFIFFTFFSFSLIFYIFLVFLPFALAPADLALQSRLRLVRCTCSPSISLLTCSLYLITHPIYSAWFSPFLVSVFCDPLASVLSCSGQFACWFVCPVSVTCALPSEDFGPLFWFSTWTVFDSGTARRSQPCLHLA